MTFVLNNDIHKIVRGDLELHRLMDDSFMLIQRFGDRVIENITLTKEQWEILWEMLTEE